MPAPQALTIYRETFIKLIVLFLLSPVTFHQPVFLIPAAIPLIVNNAPRSNSPLL
jgi:hypothetical protein